MNVSIGRTSGPCTDEEVVGDFTPADLETIKDVLAMVNAASSNKEGWFVRMEDGPVVVPSVNVVKNSRWDA